MTHEGEPQKEIQTQYEAVNRSFTDLVKEHAGYDEGVALPIGGQVEKRFQAEKTLFTPMPVDSVKFSIQNFTEGETPYHEVMFYFDGFETLLVESSISNADNDYHVRYSVGHDEGFVPLEDKAECIGLLNGVQDLLRPLLQNGELRPTEED